MILHIFLYSIYGTALVFLAETERVPWLVALPALIVGLAVLIYYPRIKEVKVAGAEIKLFEKQAEAISKTQIEAIKLEANSQREALGKVVEEAKESQRQLKRLAALIAPRNFDHDAFDRALAGQPTYRVEIMYVKDDAESFRLSLQIRDALRRSKWEALEPIPIPVINDQLPSAMSVGGQPSGVTVVANKILVAEAKDELRPKTPYMILSDAIAAAMHGYCNGGPIRNGRLPDGTLRIVVAPKAT